MPVTIYHRLCKTNGEQKKYGSELDKTKAGRKKSRVEIQKPSRDSVPWYNNRLYRGWTPNHVVPTSIFVVYIMKRKVGRYICSLVYTQS